MTRTCKECGTGFDGGRPDKVFCSRACQKLHKRKWLRSEEGKEIARALGKQRYRAERERFLASLSAEPALCFECYGLAHRLDEPCPKCGLEPKELEPAHAEASVGCGLAALCEEPSTEQEAESVNRIDDRYKELTCPECGKVFGTTREDRQYCTAMCRMTAQRRREKQAYAARRKAAAAAAA